MTGVYCEAAERRWRRRENVIVILYKGEIK
jgi:hypothetical protein